MEEIGKALKVIFDKLSDFFDIFDLSFFVSGFFTTSIILVWAHFRGIGIYIKFTETFNIIAFVLFCYINGLLSFAVGRWIRMGILAYPFKQWRKARKKTKYFDSNFLNILKAHGLTNDPTIAEYLSRTNERGIWRLYVRFWAELRDNEKYSKSLSFLKRYWVMSATYDGLSISVLISIILLVETKLGLVGNALIIEDRLFWTAITLLTFIFGACLREAYRFIEYQVEEVVATFASKR